MTESGFAFVCLDPRKAKRDAISTALRPLGRLSFLKIPPMARGDFPETHTRVAAAFAAGTKIPGTGLMEHAKKTLLRLQYNGTRRYFAKQPKVVAVAWNGLNGSRRVFMDAARDAGARRLYFELAPFKGRITADPGGVNYANSLPRDPAPYLAWADATQPDDTWRRVGASITARAPAHAKAAGDGTQAALSEPFIFVPLQVPGDSQLRLFGGAFRTVEATIAAVAQAAQKLPDGWHLRIKEHPTSPERFDQLVAKLSHSKLVLDNTTDTFAQVAAARAVVTVNSSVGLEAMFFDKPVVALGDCFWAIPGVAHHAPTQTELDHLLSDPTAMTFDPASRAAFLAFLIDRYYPDLTCKGDSGHLHPDEAAKIQDRLTGADRFGFWASDTGHMP